MSVLEHFFFRAMFSLQKPLTSCSRPKKCVYTGELAEIFCSSIPQKYLHKKLKVEISGHKRECDIVIALLRGKAKIMIFTKRVSFAICPEKVNIDTFWLTLTN